MEEIFIWNDRYSIKTRRCQAEAANGAENANQKNRADHPLSGPHIHFNLKAISGLKSGNAPAEYPAAYPEMLPVTL